MPTLPFDPSQIAADITKAHDFIFAYRRSPYPFTLNTATINRIHFHNPLSKFLLYPLDSGSAYIQAFLAKVMYQIYGVTGNTTHRDRAGDLINALLFYFYKNTIPTSGFSDYWLPNAYVNANDLNAITTLGNQANGTPFNYGYFDVAIAFTSGVATLNSDLAYVYNVYAVNNKVVIENVHATTLLDNSYAIDYFVVNYNLKGANYRIYSDLTLQATGETAGTIKLTTNYSGNLRVTYARYNGATVARANAANNGTGFLAINPVWFKDQDSVYLESGVFYAAYDAFKTAFQYTSNASYDLAATHTKNAFLKLLSELENITYLYKTEGYPNPLRYPGSKAIAFLATTETTGELIRYLRLQGNTVEFYNFLVQVEWAEQSLLSLNAASNVEQIVTLYCSTKPNTSINYDSAYTAKLLLKGDSKNTFAQFGIEDFRRFVNGYYYLASNSSFLTVDVKFNGFVSQQLRQTESYYSSTLCNAIVFSKPESRDESRIVLSGEFEFPFNIRYSSSLPLKLRVKDQNNVYWYADIPKTNQFYYAPNNQSKDKVFQSTEINNDLFYSKTPDFVQLAQVILGAGFTYCGTGKLSIYDDYGVVYYDKANTGEVKIVLFQGNVVSKLISAGFFTLKDFDFVGIGDFDGDNLDEILFISNRNHATGYRPLIRDLNLDGTGKTDFLLPTVGSSPTTSGGWYLVSPIKVRNLNHDLLWSNYLDRSYYIWRINNNNHTVGDSYTLFVDSVPYPDTQNNAWVLQDVKDFNNDGIDDLFFVSKKTDENADNIPNKPRIILLKSTNETASVDKTLYYPEMPGQVTGEWQYQLSAKLSLDGNLDVFWRNLITNQILVWFLDDDLSLGSTQYLSVVPSNYTAIASTDINRDGFNDILWISGSTFYVWYLDGFAKLFKDKQVYEIAIEPSEIGSSELLLDYIGKAPLTLEPGSKTYVHGIKEGINTSHNLWVGDFYVLNNQLVDNKYFKSCLPKNIAIAPTNKLKSHDGVISAKNQSPYHCTIFGSSDAYIGQANLINDAFKDYFADIGEYIGITPDLINTSFWDSADYVRYGRPVRQLSFYKAAFPIPFLFKVLQTDAVIYFVIEDNEFVWSVENSESAYNQYKPLESLAKDLYLNRSENLQFKNILSNFLRHVLAGLAANSDRPYTTYKESELPTVDYTDPGLSGLIGKIALYCNLAFLETETTLEIIQRCYDFLRSQFISSGVMSGTWSASQPNFVVSSTTYKEYNLEWHCEIVDFLTLCHKYQNEINFPYESPEGVYPAIPITRINEISESPYVGNKLTSDDGSTQKQLKQIQYIGLEIEIYYERINDLALNVLSNFWIAIGGRAGVFSLPNLLQFADYRNNGEMFRFMNAPQFETFLGNQNIGLYNCTIRIQLVRRN
jgi:hypothetical protein